ncbi:penicillin-binding protein 2 [Fretibacter rubidus]|uniref:penicillin-binding protein 2 n=1 Tax=Fretibacter rubidus TaxID=570162 RepID=UPI00352B7C0D
MSDDRIDPSLITRRTAFLGVAGALGMSALTARLYYLQVVKAEDYTVLSDRNRFNFKTLIPERGRILDRNGVSLAVNRQDFQVMIVPEQVDDVDGTLDAISDIVPITDKVRARVKREAKRRARFIPVLVDSHLDWDAFAALNLRTPDLPGVALDVGQGRLYPHKGLFTHTLGYVGTAGPDDIAVDKDPLLRQPSFRIGKTGVEAASDKTLRGKAGRLKVEVNARGRVVREWPDPKEKPVSGDDVWLTLDADLQRHAADLFEEDSGGIAVIDVMTGELRTLLSMPTFDGNLFVSGLTAADMAAMNASEKRPQFNKVIGGGYPPASTFKMVVMLAGLKEGLIDPKEKIFCTGRVRLGNRNFHCWKRRGHGPMDLRDSLKQSCDVYYYEIANRLGIDPIHDMARRLGFGERFDIGISGQTSGIVPNDAWKQARLGDGWRTGDSYNAAIGQGFVLTTPLQMAVMTARLANGRRAVNPTLIIGQDLDGFDALDIDPTHLQLVRDAMWSVCEEPGGTAYRADSLGFGGIDMAGKTGTGQVRSISRAERESGVRSNERIAWELRDHSVFVGYAPFEAPRFAVATLVEHGGSGAGRAADISRQLLSMALSRDGVKPLSPEARL